MIVHMMRKTAVEKGLSCNYDFMATVGTDVFDNGSFPLRLLFHLDSRHLYNFAALFPLALCNTGTLAIVVMTSKFSFELDVLRRSLTGCM